ncbi:MAG: signal peptidase I [Eubacteriales bacterium]
METELRRTKKKDIKKKRSLRTLNIITAILVLVIMLMALLLIGIRFVGLTPYTVLSGSMEPTYHVGSLIYVKESTPDEIEVGDPITFVLNENLVVATHRVVEIDTENEQFYTKGDANKSADGSPVNFKNLIGKPVFTIPYMGYVAEFLSTQAGKIIGLTILGVLILLVFIAEIKIRKNAKD